jgi:hypothetical protein
MDLVVTIGASIALILTGLIVTLCVKMSNLKRISVQEIRSIKESLNELETKFSGDNPTLPKPAVAIPPRQYDDSYKKPILPPEKETKQPPPPTSPLKTKRW